MNATDVPAWLQAGGLVAFAAAVWMEQRAIRSTLDSMRMMMAAILEDNRSRNNHSRSPTNPAIPEDKPNDLKA
jgi:hypothetical protein